MEAHSCPALKFGMVANGHESGPVQLSRLRRDRCAQWLWIELLDAQALQQSFRAVGAAGLVNVLAQPFSQWQEFSSSELRIEIRKIALDQRPELSSDHISKRVPDKRAKRTR